MKGLFIPDITAEMFRNCCLESIEELMAEGEIYDIEYDTKFEETDVPDINVGDMISRQDAITVCNSAIDLWEGQLGVGALVAVRDKIAELTINPERKKGKWGNHGKCPFCKYLRQWFDGMAQAQSILENLPSAQPQITHCAECIHWKHSDVRKNYCEVFDWTNKAKDFCSYAERRGEQNDQH